MKRTILAAAFGFVASGTGATGAEWFTCWDGTSCAEWRFSDPKYRWQIEEQFAKCEPGRTCPNVVACRQELVMHGIEGERAGESWIIGEIVSTDVAGGDEGEFRRQCTDLGGTIVAPN
ncbi:MAG: hypothetical protein OXQ84_13645 [bacterium]|nr:hypothetical protein [bacterium]